jgi:hypothetical protein
VNSLGGAKFHLACSLKGIMNATSELGMGNFCLKVTINIFFIDSANLWGYLHRFLT